MLVMIYDDEENDDNNDDDEDDSDGHINYNYDVDDGDDW